MEKILKNNRLGMKEKNKMNEILKAKQYFKLGNIYNGKG